MSVQCETIAASGTCPRGFHDCQVRWRCPHGYVFPRHTPTGKLVTASAGSAQGPTPCSDCTAQAEARLGQVDERLLALHLSQALELTADWD
jgi:hypothetical protein